LFNFFNKDYKFPKPTTDIPKKKTWKRQRDKHYDNDNVRPLNSKRRKREKKSKTAAEEGKKGYTKYIFI